MTEPELRAYIEDCRDAIRGILDPNDPVDNLTVAMLLREFGHIHMSFLEMPEVKEWCKTNDVEIYSFFVRE